jgi:predicted nucleic acid-binding protein
LTISLVDSNVLLDIATEDPTWYDWSATALANAANDGTLIINAIIYAEVSIGFPAIEELDESLPPDTFLREALPFEAAFLAGKAFLTYRRHGGVRSSSPTWRRPLLALPDFYIGAHAAIAGYRLVTRDANRYRTYSPTVDLVTPPS